MHDKPVIDYPSANNEPLSKAEQRAFLLLLPAVIGTIVAGLFWIILFLLHL